MNLSAFFLPSYTLCKREVVRFLRQKSRVIGAIVPPVIFWFLIGSGLSGSFRHASNVLESGGLNSLQYFFPGTIVMIVLFTAVFSTISIIEDRKEGFLQSVLVAPVPRFSIVMGKIMGGTILAFFQGLVFVLLAPFMGVSFRILPLLYIFANLFAVSFGLTGLGFLIAWKMESSQGFHAIMNLFLMPMWFLSGALFPMESAPRWLKAAMMLDPLTYSVAALRYGLYSGSLRQIGIFPTAWTCLAVTLFFCGVTFLISTLVCNQRPVE